MEPMEGVKMEEIEKDQAVEEEIALINNMGAANKGVQKMQNSRRPST